MIRAAGFGATKTIEDFVFDHQFALRRDTIAHLATGVFRHAEVITLNGSTHRLRNTGIDTLPSARPEDLRPRTKTLSIAHSDDPGPRHSR